MPDLDLYAIHGLDWRAPSEQLAAQLTAQLSAASDPLVRQRIDTARAILGDPARRARYDAHLADPQAPPIDEATLAGLALQPSARAATFGPAPSDPRPMANLGPQRHLTPRTSRGLSKKWFAIGGVGLIVLLVIVIGVATIRPTSTRSDCADVVFIGAAGSGQRTGEKAASTSGMGEFVDVTYKNLLSDANDAGKTVEKLPVEYPAAPISTALSETFKDSVETGAQAASQMISRSIAECPDSVVVAAGYSQGAMVMHRALHGLEPQQSLLGIFIADGDRLPSDPNVLFGGGAKALPGISYSELGVSQSGVDSVRLFPSGWRGNLVSWCMTGDTVCANTPGKVDFDFGAGALIHTKGYDPQDWRAWLAKKALGQ